MTSEIRGHLLTDVAVHTPEAGLIVTCAALGSPVSECSRVVGAEPAELRQAVRSGQHLDRHVVTALTRWLPCLWWRTLWRIGHPDGSDRAELESVSQLALTLQWLPDDWAADLARAVLWHETRPSLKSRTGTLNGRSKLTPEDVEQMRRLDRAGWSLRRIGRRFTVSASTVHSALRGRTWK